MGIAEILAAKKASAKQREGAKVQPSISIPPNKKIPNKKLLSTPSFIIEEEQELLSPSEKVINEEFNYIASQDKYLNSYERNATFLSVYAILIRNPYQNIREFRELRDFLLGEAQYVLNTFPQLDIELLF